MMYSNRSLGNLVNRSEMASLRMPHSESFVIHISVGSPSQVLRCLLDTGFADLWLPSEECEDCKHSRFFAPDRSSTFQLAESRGSSLDLVKVPHAQGQLTGVVGQDTVGLGSAVFINQSFLLVPEVHLPRRRRWDGICGLGRHQIAPLGEPLWRRLSTSAHGGGGSFSLLPGPGQLHYFVAGEVPYKACQENSLAWAEVEPLTPGGKRDFWIFSGGLAITKRNPVKSRFMIDTGTSFLLAPPTKYFAFMRSLFLMDTFDRSCGMEASAGNVVICNCSIMQASSQLLPVRFYIGGNAFKMKIPDLFTRVPAAGGGELCLLQIQRNPVVSVDPLDLMGDLLGSSRRPTRRQGASLEQPPVSLSGVAAPISATAAELSARKAAGRGAREPRGGLPNGEQDTGAAWGEVPSNQNLEEDLWVLGGVFIERFMVVLDTDNHRVGICEPGSLEVFGLGHHKNKGVSIAAKNNKDLSDIEIGFLREQNADLRSQLGNMLHYYENGLEKDAVEKELQAKLLAGRHTLEQHNQRLQQQLQILRDSHEQSKAGYEEVRFEAVQMRSELRGLQTRIVAMRKQSGDLVTENQSLRAGERRMWFMVLTIAGFSTLCAGHFAYKALGRRALGGMRFGVPEGKAHEVRDVAPLLLRGAVATARKDNTLAEVDAE